MGPGRLFEIQHDSPIFNIKKRGGEEFLDSFRSLFPEFVVSSFQFLVSKAYHTPRIRGSTVSYLHFFKNDSTCTSYIKNVVLNEGEVVR